MLGDAAPGEVHRHVTAQRTVVGEVAFDVLSLVAERDDEVLEAVMGVVAHDVPQDRLVADLDHCLGSDLGLLRQSGAESSSQ